METIRDRVLVDPQYDAEKLGSLYLPEMGKNKESQQGVVLAAGPESGVVVGDHIFYHPYRGQVHRIDGKKILSLRRKDLVAILGTLDGHPMPLPVSDHVMVMPNWEAKYKQPSSLLYMPPTVMEQNQPTITGIITWIGREVWCMPHWEFTVGNEVIIEPNKGSEIGWGPTMQVYYYLRPQHILACLR